MGTPEFALPSLSLLLDNAYDIPAVVTVPDKPQGRGQKTGSSPVKKAALEHGIPILQPADLNDPVFTNALLVLNADLFVVVAFRILPAKVFRIPHKGAFNLHASLLPKYRGAAPINWAIMNGEQETGVTTFMLKERVDTGSIILRARTKIGPDETAGELHDKLAAIGAEIVLQSVRLIEQGKAVLSEQDESKASKAPKIFTNDCRIDWREPAQRIHDRVRGLSPSPTAWTKHAGKVLKLFRTKRLEEKSGHRPGEVVRSDKKELHVMTGDGLLSILELQLEGRNRMMAEEFLRGYALPSGDLLE